MHDVLVPTNQCLITNVKEICLRLHNFSKHKLLARFANYQLKLPSKKTLAHNLFHHEIKDFTCLLDFYHEPVLIKIKAAFT